MPRPIKSSEPFLFIRMTTALEAETSLQNKRRTLVDPGAPSGTGFGATDC